MGDRVFVTGANGFVGRAVCTRLIGDGHRVSAGVRSLEAGLPEGARAWVTGPIETASWAEHLPGHDAVVHLAARVHVMRDASADPLAAFRAMNTDATVRLARAAAAAGVRRFLFMSTIKVCGESTGARPFDEACAPAPQDDYGRSKWEAEQQLERIAAATGMAVTVIRPPLVYGPGVGANFLRLLGWVDRGIPLPLASVENRRSLISVWNLADVVVRCLTHPGAAGQVFTVSDGHDLSTPELIRALAAALDRRPRLWPCPARLLRVLASLAGQGAAADRLLGSLQVSNERVAARLGWCPPVPQAEGLRRTARWYRATVQGTDAAGSVAA